MLTFYLNSIILPHFRNGTTEVHLLFDDAECQVQSPKMFERQLRDQKKPISDDHCCSNFTGDMVIHQSGGKMFSTVEGAREILLVFSLIILSQENQTTTTTKICYSWRVQWSVKQPSTFY